MMSIMDLVSTTQVSLGIYQSTLYARQIEHLPHEQRFESTAGR